MLKFIYFRCVFFLFVVISIPNFVPHFFVTAVPRPQPTSQPFGQPSGQPSNSFSPTVAPSNFSPTVAPSSLSPTTQPSLGPSAIPSQIQLLSRQDLLPRYLLLNRPFLPLFDLILVLVTNRQLNRQLNRQANHRAAPLVIRQAPQSL